MLDRTCHITSRHVKSHHITSHHITSRHVTSHPHHVTSRHVTSTSRHITSHHITSHHIHITSHPHHITSHHITSTSRHITSHHVTSHHIHITSRHLTSHHIPTSQRTVKTVVRSVEYLTGKGIIVTWLNYIWRGERRFSNFLSLRSPESRLQSISIFYLTLFNSVATKLFLSRKILEGYLPPPFHTPSKVLPLGKVSGLCGH